MAATQILNATTGNSSEFSTADKRITFRLSISGTASSAIQAFVDVGLGVFSPSILLKIKGITDSGATVKLQAKLNSSSDTDFDDTGRVFSQDFCGYYNEFKIK